MDGGKTTIFLQAFSRKYIQQHQAAGQVQIYLTFLSKCDPSITRKGTCPLEPTQAYGNKI